MNNIKYLILISLFVFGCTKYIEFDAEDTKSKIVLNGLLIENDVAVVNVSKSLPILDEGTLSFIDNAVVKLYKADSGEFIEDLALDGLGYYYGSQLLSLSSNYQVKVTAPGFDDVNAITYIPINNLNVSLPLDTSTILNGDNLFFSDEFEVKFEFTDNGDEDNYYGVKVTGISTAVGDFEQLIDLHIDDDNVVMEYGNEILFEDKLFNGGSRELVLRFNKTNYESVTGEFVNYDSLNFVISSYSRDIFLYQKSYATYYNSDIFGQPVQVYSNVEAGLGVLGGVKTNSFTIAVE